MGSELPQITDISIPRCYYPKSALIQSISTTWIFRCFRASLCWSCLSSNDQHQWSCVHIPCQLQNQGCAYQTADITQTGTMWSQSACQVAVSCQGCSESTSPGRTDSTVVLNGLDGNPRRFQTFVGNRVACIMELIPSNHWRHVRDQENPADYASRVCSLRSWWDTVFGGMVPSG